MLLCRMSWHQIKRSKHSDLLCLLWNLFYYCCFYILTKINCDKHLLKTYIWAYLIETLHDYMHIYIYINMHTYTYTYTYVYIHTYIDKDFQDTHTHTHKHIYIYIHYFIEYSVYTSTVRTFILQFYQNTLFVNKVGECYLPMRRQYFSITYIYIYIYMLRNPNWRKFISTVHLLVLTSSDQLFFILKHFFLQKVS